MNKLIFDGEAGISGLRSNTLVLPLSVTIQPAGAVKTSAWKNAQQERLRRQIRDYLARGGEIHRVPAGESGMRPDGPRHHQAFSGAPRADRTPLPEVVAAIEARKKANQKKTAARRPNKRPRRKLIYDDFGEPLRWVWDNDER